MTLIRKLYKLNSIEHFIYIFIDSNYKIWFKTKELKNECI